MSHIVVFFAQPCNPFLAELWAAQGAQSGYEIHPVKRATCNSNLQFLTSPTWDMIVVQCIFLLFEKYQIVNEIRIVK